MSNVVEHDFGRSPFIEVGDSLTFVWNGPNGEGIARQSTGVVLSIQRLYRFGSIAGQAREMEVGIPLDDGSFEGSWQLVDIKFTDIVARKYKPLAAYEEKEGKVLGFEPVSCNRPADRV